MDTAVLTARSLVLDLMALEVTGALRAAGVESLLLKGASFAAWLFGDGTPRPYADCDVLVAPAQLGAAERVLEGLGFRRLHEGDAAAGLGDEKHHGWLRADGLLELHWRIPGIGLAADEAWEVLLADAAVLEIAGGTVPVLSPDARALHLVLHAELHERGHAGTERDLARALAVLSPADWEAAAALARTLRAEHAMGLGLRRVPAGAELADRLHLPARASTAAMLRGMQAPPGAHGLAHVLSPLPGESRGRRIAHHLFPPPLVMRELSPVARRPRGGLQAAYALRAARRATQLPRAALAVYRAR